MYVESYTREDGTEVKGHYRSKPCEGVVNHTSEKISVKEESNATMNTVKTKEEQSNIKSKTNDTAEEKQKSINKEKTDLDSVTKKEKMMFPEKVAGVERGEPKTFEQMMQQGVNPKLNSKEDVDGRYSNNCACVHLQEL